jgi:putative SOS response-associated peptidase YedK
VYDDPAPGEGAPRFSILTCAPNAELQAVHDRMPVVLAPDAAEEWLRRGPLGCLRPAPDGTLVGEPANPVVNRPGVDGPECLREPPGDALDEALDLFARKRDE